MRFDVYHHNCKCSTHENQVQLDLIITGLENIMATLDELLTAVTENSSVDDSIITLLEGIAAQLKDALSGAVLPPVVQAKVDAVFAAIKADTQKVTDAITANTPQAPPV